MGRPWRSSCTKNVPFSLKQSSEALLAGVVEGYAAVFGNVVGGDDLIDPGAFAKTIAESGGRVKMDWQHAAPFGVTTYIAEVGRDSLPPQSCSAPLAPLAASTFAARPT